MKDKTMLFQIESKDSKEVQKVLKETGLDQMQNKLIKNLSRGQKQRVSLAGTLVVIWVIFLAIKMQEERCNHLIAVKLLKFY